MLELDVADLSRAVVLSLGTHRTQGRTIYRDNARRLLGETT